MKLTKVQVEKLFDYFDYTIELNENITIIHGPNGCGKTTTLRIIDAVFNQDSEYLKNTIFSSVQFTFSDETILKVDRKRINFDEKNKMGNGIIYLVYTIIRNEEKNVYDTFENPSEHTDVISRCMSRNRPLPFLEKESDDVWHDRRTGKNLTRDQVISKYWAAIYSRYNQEQQIEYIPEEVQMLVHKIDVRMIAADRLTVERKIEDRFGEVDIEIEQRVKLIAEEVSKKIREAIQEYAQVSQAKDRTFPLRTIKQNLLMSVDEIIKKLEELENKRKEYVDTGILENENEDIEEHDLVQAITEDNRQIFSLYVSDTEEKLNSLSNLSSSINLFRKLIDNSFINKKIVFNKDYGFRFMASYSEAIIHPQNLSSGEQHELVMFYDLIFNTAENTLILIDEPELSLHIKWQLNYIDEIQSIISKTGFCAVLATHSPQIIHDNWNMTVALSKAE